MTKISSMVFRKKFDSILDAVADQKKPLIITRWNRPAVVLRPHDPIRDGVDWRAECTPFQRKVYEAILKIPKGQVRTYAEVARAIGRPKAAQAVGQALKRNRWAPSIPCHRVVASDGTLGGYSGPGGLSAKHRLLAREGANIVNI